MKRKLILAGIIIVALGIFGWAATHATLRVNVAESGAGVYHYQVRNADGKVIIDQDSGANISKVVGRGTYQVTVTGDNASYIATTKTSGFLRTTTIAAALEPEAGRRFVGTNPGSCMYYTDHLISGPCGSPLYNLKTHVPATAVQPSYTNDLPTGNFNTASTATQIIPMPGGSYLGFTAQAQENESRPAGYYLNALRPDFSVASVQALKSLSISDAYFAKPYKDGILLYDGSLQKVWYLTGTNLQPLQIDKPEQSGMRLATVETNSGTITAVFTDLPTGIDNNSDSSYAAKDSHSEVIIFKDGASQHFSFDTAVTAAQTCGTNKLCTLSGSRLTVYSIDSGHLEPVSILDGVANIIGSQERPIIVTNQGVIDYDADSQDGHFIYSFGKYQYCGINEAPNGYLLCVIDAKGQHQALYLTPGSPNTNIDKRVYDLANVRGISSVSVYENRIFIAPDYGQTSYDWDTQSVTYSPTVVTAVDKTIAQAVAQAGLNQDPYVVINTGKQ